MATNPNALSPEEKRELLRKLLKEKKGGNVARTIPVVAREERLRLTALQERMWLLNQRQQESISNLFFGFRLRGALSVPAVEASLNGLLERHEALRTLYRLEGAEPLQRVSPFAPITLPLIDLSPLGDDALDEAMQLASEEVQTRFDLGQAPAARFRLYRLDGADHLLVWIVHHIGFDDWSFGIAAREFSEAYRAHVTGADVQLAAPSVQYADFAQWQRRRLEDGSLGDQLSWWDAQLEGAPQLDLPTERPRPAHPTHAVGSARFTVPAELVKKLGALAQSEKATSSMVFLTGYAALLARYSGQEDFVIASPVAGRTRPELEGVVGFFANIQPLRLRLRGEPSWRALLMAVRELCVGAYVRQDVPIEAMSARQGDRQTRASELVRVTFNVNALMPNLSLEGLEVSSVHLPPERTYVDLGLMLEELPDGGYEGVLGYSRDLFDATTAERIAEHYVTLLESLASAPDERVSRASMLSLRERQRVLVELNQTAAERPSACVHELFEAQARKTPDAPAVMFEGRGYTYRELSERSDALCAHLVELGVAPEVKVALCLRPSLETIVALLGVLKAGGAYVPLDPDAPWERLANILEQCEAGVLLTEMSLVPQLPVGDREVFLIDGWDGAAPQTKTRELQAPTPDNLAYVLFTSGSSGEPKGVLIAHRALANHNLAVAKLFSLSAADRVLQFTPIFFDAAGEEIYPPLLHGASVVVRGELVPSAEFRDAIERDRLTFLSLPPAYLHEWVAGLSRQGLTLPGCLRTVILGGEKLLPETLALWQRVGGTNIPWFNVYGPTEATITAAAARIQGGGGLDAPSLPIGGPIENVRMYLLDANFEPVPMGQPGEIFIAGAGLARGYVAKPDQTAERFLPDPFSTEPGARMYRTGDLGRHRADGQIEFVGRADNQVKIRGFRIELGEVEAALRKHAGVQEAVVLAREDTPGDKRLVAYVVAEPGVTLLRNELRKAATDKLPEYMVPTSFVLLESLPLTANGKVDRKALPPAPPDALETLETGGEKGPSTLLELRLASIWCEELAVPAVGREADFFLAGGHSLLALRVLERIRETCGVELSIAAFFENPTVRQLAALIEAQTAVGENTVVVPVQPTGEGTPVFFVHSLFGDLDIYVKLLSEAKLRSPLWGLRAPELSGSRAYDTVTERAAYYAQEVRRVQPQGPYRIVGYSVGGTYALELARCLIAGGAEVELALFDARVTWEEDTKRVLEITEGASEQDDLLRVAFDFGCDIDAMRALPEEARFDFLVDFEKQTGRVSPSFTASDLKRTLRVFRAGINGLLSFAPERYPGRIELFLSEESRAEGGATLDWERVAPGRVRVHAVEGTHSEMMQPPHVASLATALQKAFTSAL